jgi:hypothetical protein
LVIELIMIGVVAYKATTCLGYGLGTVAKAKIAARLIDGQRKVIRLPMENGQAVSISVDEFVDADGVKTVEFAVFTTQDGKSTVLTKAETAMFQNIAVSKGLLDSDVSLSAREWRSILSPLFDAVEKRREEIKRSPSRQGRR